MTSLPGSGQNPSVASHHRARAVLVLLFLLLSACATPAASSVGGVPDPLHVGLIPNVAPDRQRARYAALGEHLEGALGVNVELFVASDYAGVVTALAADRLDVAYLGGLTYLQAGEQVGLEPLVTEIDRETGTTRYVSAIVVPADSPHDELSDLLATGATMAFGDVSSTSGSLYPRVMLVDAGAACSTTQLQSCPPLGAISFTGGHDAAAQAVLAGQADAAGLELRILRRLEHEGVVPRGALRVLAAAEVEGYPWVARSALGADAHDAVTAAFTAIDDAGLLDLLRAQRYVEVDAADYDDMRERAMALGLLGAR